MSISLISSVTTAPASAKPAPDGNSPAVEAAEATKATKAAGSRATKVAKQANGGTAPKGAPASAGKSSSSTNDLPELIMFSSQHMSTFQIAHRLGKSVSDIMAEAAAAGINLRAGSTSASSSSIYSVIKSVNAAIGKGTNIDKTV